MEKNQNNDNRNQGKADNVSNQKTNQDYSKKETNPNNPVAKRDKQNGQENTNGKQKITNQDKSITNQDKSKTGFKNSNQRDDEPDGETPRSNKTTDFNSKQNENKSTNQNTRR